MHPPKPLRPLTSWRSSLLGLCAALAILLPQIAALVDADPATQLDLDTVLSAFAILGIGLVSRDANKSSQDHKIR